ncbi:MAG: hypothetical protein U0W24_19455 [Bacteroidales bacterium]
MKKFIFLFISFLSIIRISAFELNAELFYFDEQKIQNEFGNLSEIEREIKEVAGLSMDSLYENSMSINEFNFNSISLFYNVQETTAPGKLPSFWFTFALSAVGTYFIYGAVAGPISVGIVYFSSDKDRDETKKAIWGCLAGTLVGAGIKYLVVNL